MGPGCVCVCVGVGGGVGGGRRSVRLTSSRFLLEVGGGGD